MAKAKICGITNLEDARFAVECGAYALGFNFYPPSPRYIDPDEAEKIIAKLPEKLLKVGVFVNESIENILNTINVAGITAIQLHGDERPGFISHLKSATDLIVIKSIRVTPDFNPGSVLNYGADAILLDTYSKYEYGGTGETFNWDLALEARKIFPKVYLAGGLSTENVADAIKTVEPFAVDACSLLESSKGIKDLSKLQDFISQTKSTPMNYEPDINGYWGEYGGRFVPETLVAPLDELIAAYLSIRGDAHFEKELADLLNDFSGRPTSLFYAKRLSEKLDGAKIYLKREDLNHTGAHKINNALGQALLARKMGKRRIIAETGAGQHGVATATVCAQFGLECVIYMGTEDMRRQELNVFRMRLLGAEVRAVDSGSCTLKDAINEALRDWVTNIANTYYLLGSALGPHPYPLMVRDFQSIIGSEARKQILEKEGRLPDTLVACVGGGSNAIGLFHTFLEVKDVKMIGVEAGGTGSDLGKHAARFMHEGEIGILQGTKSYVLQDADGQIASTHSISAGLDYPSVGPEHAFLHDKGRVEYVSVSDEEALAAFKLLSETEGIIPALESSHAIAYAIKLAPQMSPDQIMIVNLSGRGDKDVGTIVEMENSQ